MENEVIALLGRRDFPTDGLEDYCTWLARELFKRGYAMKMLRVPWSEQGRLRSLRRLWQESAQWQGKWVLLQYTTFSWPARGFPLGFLLFLWLLKQRQARLAIVFHERYDYEVIRLIDRLRRASQFWVMGTAYRWAEKSILTLPLEATPWLPPNPTKAVLIPVGTNVPEPDKIPETRNEVKTVAVFGITGGSTEAEVADIAHALKRAVRQVPRLRLVAVGRGTTKAKELLQQALKETPVEILVLGLVEQEEVSQTLVASDVLLFVRGCICTGRTSAVAGVACGLPIVAYSGPETGHPITEAGVLLAPLGDRDALAEAMTRVLSDDRLWQELHQRSLKAQKEYFSWKAIAEQFLKILNNRLLA